MKIINSKNNYMLADDCKVAGTFYSRFKGLMGVDELPKGAGLHILPCNSIHMFFMRIPLDIIFINKENEVVHIVEGIKPWRVTNIIKNAHSVIELPVGTISSTHTFPGDRLDFI